MNYSPDNFSRIDKFFVDRDGERPEVASNNRRSMTLDYSCGPELGHCTQLQASLLTAVNTGHRCFPGCVRVTMSELVASSAIKVPWAQGITLREAVRSLGGRVQSEPVGESYVRLCWGNCPIKSNSLQVTFDGWVGAVRVGQQRLPESGSMVLSGVLAGALAVMEIFFKFAGIVPTACRRDIGLSLWNPSQPLSGTDAIGPNEYWLPASGWVLGLGHLGQALLWSMSFLPYQRRDEINLILHDYDRVVRANLDTGLVVGKSSVGKLKTQVTRQWLERRGFRPRVVERPFDGTELVSSTDPRLAFCGFDQGGPRHLLDRCGFDMIFEAGLGGEHHDFFKLLTHAWPKTQPRAERLWPAETRAGVPMDEQRILNNPIYKQVHSHNHCGHVELAGKAVGVPFVGTVAACLSLAEAIRTASGGPQFDCLDCSLAGPRVFADPRNHPVDLRSAVQSPVVN